MDNLNDLIEINEISTEHNRVLHRLTELDGYLEIGIESMESLTNLSSALENKELPTDALLISKIAIESIRIRLGLSKQDNDIALEDMASIGKTIKNTILLIYEHIKRILTVIWEKIVILFHKLIHSKERLIRTHKDLSKRTKDLKGVAPTTFLENQYMAEFFSEKYKANYHTVLSMVNRIDEAISCSTHGTNDLLKEVRGFKLMRGIDAKEYTNNIIRNYFSSLKPISTYTVEGTNYITYGPFPGAKVLVVSSKTKAVSETFNEELVTSALFFPYEELEDKIELINNKKDIEVLLSMTNPVRFNYDDQLNRTNVVITNINRISNEIKHKLDTNNKLILDKYRYKSENDAKAPGDLVNFFHKLKYITEFMVTIVSKLPIMHFRLLQNTFRYIEASLPHFSEIAEHSRDRSQDFDNVNDHLKALTHV